MPLKCVKYVVVDAQLIKLFEIGDVYFSWPKAADGRVSSQRVVSSDYGSKSTIIEQLKLNDKFRAQGRFP